MKNFCCFIVTVQIALSANTALAILSSMHGIKRPHQPTLQQDSVPLASVSSKTSTVPDEMFASNHITHTEDAVVFNVVTLTKNQFLLFCHRKRLRRFLPCMVYLANLRQKKVLTFVLLVADVDPERNAIRTPSQETLKNIHRS
jgi:hypothetical protein